ncbi:MAG: sensor domain-containing diguanylate cyclase [Aquificaceae bacterium]|nr:sensor domain-containing diguanylate cyclase [Aquificaceae bacterium]MCX8060924.1 sensor domain-containing diguanylate cyclase [Aquificaceae bacterium]MDW8097013.1 diguanylate cyclase [Aquificaceae bacterium]
MRLTYQSRALLLSFLVFLSLTLPFLSFMNYLEKKSVESVLEKCKTATEKYIAAVLLSQEKSLRDYVRFHLGGQEVQELMKRALEGEESQVREELYTRLWQPYQQLKERAMVKDMHLVLPDGRVLLRLHTPHLYGDNLREVNPVVAGALREWSPQKGLGTDRFLVGYVHVYPLENGAGEKLGLVVFYTSLRAIKESLQEINPVSYLFLIRESVLKELPPEQKVYYRQVQGLKGWLVENPNGALPQKEQELLNSLLLREDFLRALSAPGNHTTVFNSGGSYYKAIVFKMGKEDTVLVSMPSGQDIRNIFRSYHTYKLVFSGLAFVVALYTFFYVRGVYRLELSYKELQAVLSLTNAGVVVLDSLGRIKLFNTPALEMLGYAPEELSGKVFHTMVSRDELPPLLDTSYRGEASLVRKDGETLQVELTVNPIKVAHFTEGVVLSFHDITERKEREKDLYYRASHDLLTGLFNRWYAEDFCRKEIAQARRQGSALSLLLIDVDDFKAVNDAYGHAVGDQVLKALAQTLKSSLRDYDLLARWGGEEFLVLLSGDGLGSALATAERLRSRVEGSSHPGLPSVSVSIGVATYRKGDTFETLLERADRALYRAKEQGKNRVVAEE